MSVQLSITTGRDSYAPGEEVSGTVELLEPVRAKVLTLALECRDWTSDYHAVGRTVPLGSPLHEGSLEQGASFSFSVVLPADALPNQSGRLGSTSWGLHARIVRLGPDLNAWHPVNVPAPVRAVRS